MSHYDHDNQADTVIDRDEILNEAHLDVKDLKLRQMKLPRMEQEQPDIM